MSSALKIYLNTYFFDTALIALLAGVSFLYYKRRSRLIKLLGWLMVFSFLANGLAFFLPGSVRNIPASVYDFVLVLMLGLLYNNQTNSQHKKYFAFSTIVFFVAGTLNLLLLQQLSISSYNKLFSSFIFITYAIVYFYKLMKDLPEKQVHHLPMFWFNSAFLIYHAGTLFLFAFTSYLINVLKNDLIYYMMFHNALSILHHLIIFVGLFYDLKRLKISETGLLSNYFS
jgi:hypothetical protein